RRPISRSRVDRASAQSGARRHGAGLPRFPPPAGGLASASASYAPLTSRGRHPGRTSEVAMHILVVEDDPFLRQGLVDLLRGAGHEPTLVGDGREAAAAGLDGAVELVVLDLTLPGLDGLEV